MPSLIQPSFARGEFAPDLYGRVDIAGYQVALRTAVNLIIHAYGGGSNRPGLMHVGPCKTHTGTPPRLVPFKFNTQDTYILEFGNLYMRVIREDAYVLETAVNISGVTQANPGVVTASSHGYSNGDQVFISDVVGMTQLNGRYFTVAGATTHTFQLTTQQTGSNVNTTSYTAYSSGGKVSKVYEIATPYASSELMEMGIVQSANVMTLAHRNHNPRELTRTDHDAWALSEITFAPDQDHVEDVAVTVDSGSGTDTYYQVTAINEETEEESLPGLDSVDMAITAATKANPVVITSSSHGLSNGDEIEINSVSGMTELNGRRFTVAGKTTNTFQLEGEDGSSYTTYSSGGVANRTFTMVSGASSPSNTVTFAAVAGAYKYSVYRKDNGLYGWLGDSEELSFKDDNIEAFLALTPPRSRNPFFASTEKPRAVTYYEQRRVFGNTSAKPDTSFYSVTGSQSSMAQSSPRQADDSITATLNSLEVNAIMAYVPLNDLIILTAGSEWKVNSGDDVAFSAETLRQKPQTNWGSSYLKPLVIGDKVLFATENRSYIRTLGYELSIDGYSGNDMTIFAPHIFENSQIADWDFTRWPDPIVVTVREDGWAPAMTFNPEQEVIAWSRWKTAGKFHRVAVVRPSSASIDPAAYYVVERKIGGSSAYYVERIASRRFVDVRDCFFVDSGLSLDDPKTITGATAAKPVIVTATSHGFSAGDLVDISDILWDPNVDSVYTETQPDQLNDRRYYIADVTSNTFALVSNEGRIDITAATKANPVSITAAGHGLSTGDVIGIFGVVGMTEINGRTFTVTKTSDDAFTLNSENGTGHTTYVSGGTAYTAEDGTAFNAYDQDGAARKAVTSITGAWHLEGEEVVILADGNVVSGKTVSSGGVTLDRAASRVHMGLRYISDMETLNPEVTGRNGETLQGREIRVPSATIRMKDTRGIMVGPDAANLDQVKQREFEKYGEPTNLLTGDKEVDLTSDWDAGGRVYIRQVNPLPMTITAIIPYLDLGSEDQD